MSQPLCEDDQKENHQMREPPLVGKSPSLQRWLQLRRPTPQISLACRLADGDNVSVGSR